MEALAIRRGRVFRPGRSDIGSENDGTVRGLIDGGKYTLPSTPLVVNIDVPYDDIGVATEDLAADLADLHEWTGNAVRDVLDRVDAVGAWAANQELANFSDKQQLRTELRSESDGILAARADRCRRGRRTSPGRTGQHPPDRSRQRAFYLSETRSWPARLDG